MVAVFIAQTPFSIIEGIEGIGIEWKITFKTRVQSLVVMMRVFNFQNFPFFHHQLQMSSHYDTPVPHRMSSDPKLMKYRRRVLNPRNLVLTSGQRKIKLGSHFLVAGVVVYSVLFANWGEKEHCFSGIRRHYHKQLDSFFTITAEDEIEMAARKGKK